VVQELAAPCIFCRDTFLARTIYGASLLEVVGLNVVELQNQIISDLKKSFLTSNIIDLRIKFGSDGL